MWGDEVRVVNSPQKLLTGSRAQNAQQVLMCIPLSAPRPAPLRASMICKVSETTRHLRCCVCCCCCCCWAVVVDACGLGCLASCWSA